MASRGGKEEARRRRSKRRKQRACSFFPLSSLFFFLFFFFFLPVLVVVVVFARDVGGDDDGKHTPIGVNGGGVFVKATTTTTTTRRMLQQQQQKEEEEDRGGTFDLLAGKASGDGDAENRHDRMRRERREGAVRREEGNRLETTTAERPRGGDEEGKKGDGTDPHLRLERHRRRHQEQLLRYRGMEKGKERWHAVRRERSAAAATFSFPPPPPPSPSPSPSPPLPSPPPREMKEEVAVVKEYPVLNPDNDRCVHGYPSSKDGHECICNTDWTGAKCDENPAPSCDRFTFGSCGDVLTRQITVRPRSAPEIKEFPSCKCVDECIEYTLKAFGKETYEVMTREGGGGKRPFQMNLRTEHFCKVGDVDDGNIDSDSSISSIGLLHKQPQDEEYRRSYIFEYDKPTRQALREKSGNVNADRNVDKVVFDRLRSKIITIEDHGNQFANSYVQNEGICSPLCEKNGKCEWFECACNKGRFGYECALSEEEILQAKKNSEERYAKNELSLAAADLPGGIKRFYRGHKYKNNGSYRGVHYFFETMIADAGVVDPNGAESLRSTMVIPFFPGDLVGNIGSFTTVMERVIEYVDKKYSLKEAVHPTVWINAMDRSLCTLQTDVHSELPPGAIVVSQYGMWRTKEGNHECFYPNRDIVIPSSLSESPGYGGDKDPKHTRFDPNTKDGMLLFFRGRAKNFKQCTGENIFTNVKECMYLYSQGIRTFMSDWYKNEPRFFLNKNVMSPEFSKYGGVGELARSENIRLRSYFCLAAGGNGWDQRFFDAIHRGCVPLMTQLNTSHPYDFLLDYDTFTVFIPNGSQDLKRVPEILDKTVQSGTHSNMVKNLRVVHEAFAWSGGNFRDTLSEKDTFLVHNGAYHHAVWAIAHRSGKEIPSSSAVQLCRLYFHNPYHANANDILYADVREKLKQRCFSDEILSKSKSTT